jgi:hypothetical protein
VRAHCAAASEASRHVASTVATKRMAEGDCQQAELRRCVRFELGWRPVLGAASLPVLVPRQAGSHGRLVPSVELSDVKH